MKTHHMFTGDGGPEDYDGNGPSYEAGFGSWEGDGFGGGSDQHGTHNVSDHGDGPQ